MIFAMRLSPIQKRLIVVAWLATIVIFAARQGLVDFIFNPTKLHSAPITDGPFAASVDENNQCILQDSKTQFRAGEVVGWQVTFSEFRTNTSILGRLDLVDLKTGMVVATETRTKTASKSRVGTVATCFSLRQSLQPGLYAINRYGILSPPSGSPMMEEFAPIYIEVVQ